MFKNIDKKTLSFIGITIGSIAIVILIIVVLVNLTSKKYYTYEEVEKLLSDATKEYYKNNVDALPSEIGTNISISEIILVNAELIKPLNELLKDGNECSANIIVTKTEDDYTYKAYLNCGDNYNSIELYKVITDEKNIVTEDSGLYNVNDEYIFKGEAKNNYITLSDKLWRIMKIDSNNNIALINQDILYRYNWDNRYNIDYDDFCGINDFNISRIKDKLKSLYNGIEILNDVDKSYLIERQWCVGKRSVNTTKKDNTECSTLSEDSLFFGLITPYEYLNVSLDKNCNKYDDRSCVNYNYLSYLDGEFWTMVGVSDNSREVFSFNSSSGLQKSRAEFEKKLGIVIYLNSEVMFKSGKGTYSEPYTLK